MEDLATTLATYDFWERLKLLRAARHLRRFSKLISEKLTKDEELDKEIKELEDEEKGKRRR